MWLVQKDASWKGLHAESRTHIRYFLALILFLISCVAQSGLAAQVTQKIAFVRKGNIWVANGDGSGQKCVITNGCAPSWSPDHKRISFARKGNVWVANADGTGQRCLTHFKILPKGQNSPDDIEISWRPGTDQITFSYPEDYRIERLHEKWHDPEPGERYVRCSSIFDVSSSVGKNHETVRFDMRDYAGTIHFVENTSPAWSPNGKRLLFARDGDIWLAEPMPYDPGTRPGSDVTRLAAVARYDEAMYRADNSTQTARHIAWSRDGKLVAYGFGREFYDSEICLMGLAYSDHGFATAGKSKLISEPWKLGAWPTFSPDGKLIAYHTQKDEIWTVCLKSGQRKLLIENGEQPAW